MATIVNTPPAYSESSSSSGMGFFFGALVLLLMLFLFFFYGLPAIRNATQAPTIQVPDQVDVNINNPGNSQPQQPGQ